MTMVWTMLSSFGATHRSLSRYVASLLAAKSRSSRRAQIASLIARSSSFAFANNGFHSSARWPIPSGLWPSATFMSWNPHPLQSTLIDVCLCKHQWCRSVPGFQLNSLCHINNQCMELYPRTPTAKTTHKIPTNAATKNSNTLENCLVTPCSILLGVTWKIWEKAGFKHLRDLTEKSVNFSTLATSSIKLLLFFGEEDQ